VKNKPWVEHKTALTPAEMLRVAVAVLVDGIDQHRVAALYGVNVGRVNKCVKVIEAAIETLLTHPNGDDNGEVV
jgi:hypothetical protein